MQPVTTTRHPSLGLLEKKSYAIMGIVNVTPDSFYDGGRYGTIDTAYDRALELLAQGADVLDIGGESSRPGASPVPQEQERNRVVPLIERLRKQTNAPISVDTTKAPVAREALDAGADWINDISAGRLDKHMAPLVAKYRCPVILMHSRKTPQTMQQQPSYNDAVREVIDELCASVNLFTHCGVARDNVILDPGIGFAKRFEDNIILLAKLDKIVGLGYTVCIGTSRKSFIGQITGKPASERLAGTLGSVASAYLKGAALFRVHDVAETKDLLDVLSTIEKR